MIFSKLEMGLFAVQSISWWE